MPLNINFSHLASRFSTSLFSTSLFSTSLEVTNTDYKFPLISCSLSKASNNALKFPLPKDFAPLR